MRNNILWSDENKIEHFCLNGKHPYGEARWCQHHAVVMFSAAGTGRLVRIKRKINGAKYRVILDENLLQTTQDLRLGQRFTFQQDNDPQHTDKTTQEWLRDNLLVTSPKL
jgi:hypothetical protein